MSKLSAKNKIFLLLAIWIVLAALMFMYFFGIVDASNQHTLEAIAVQEQDLAVLKAEKESYTQAQADLKKLAQNTLQPQDFFSKDITFVKEIQALENLSQQQNVQMQLSGITGTIDTAGKAKTITPIVSVPYSMNVTGSLPNVISFVEILENLSFITNVSQFSLSAADKGNVSVSLAGSFYLKK